MNILLSDALLAFVDEQVCQRGYGSGSDYVRELIRRDQERQALRGLLRPGSTRRTTVLQDRLRQRTGQPATLTP